MTVLNIIKSQTISGKFQCSKHIISAIHQKFSMSAPFLMSEKTDNRNSLTYFSVAGASVVSSKVSSNNIKDRGGIGGGNTKQAIDLDGEGGGGPPWKIPQIVLIFY